METASPFTRSVQHLRVLNDVVGGAVLRRLHARANAEADFSSRHNLLFIIGSGRSGTTILGRIFGSHHRVSYLNEPQHLWFAVSPDCDLWSVVAAARGGHVSFGPDDACDTSRRRFFSLVSWAASPDRPTVVEKWPINALRVRYLAKLAPRAKFIYIERDCLDVAHSIERCALQDGTWWGWNDYKWRALTHFAHSRPIYREIPDLASDHFSRGLVEWRMSHQEATSALDELPAERVHRLRYEDLVADSQLLVTKLLQFADLERSPSMQAFIDTRLESSPATAEPSLRLRLTENQAKILGPYAPGAQRA